MEHVLCHYIMAHLEQHSILNEFQYGFRPGHSCQAQLISLVEEIQQALDHHQINLVMLDFSKTFHIRSSPPKTIIEEAAILWYQG